MTERQRKPEELDLRHRRLVDKPRDLQGDDANADEHASHASGAAHITSFSAAHDITSSQAWVVSLLFMAFAEVIIRIGSIVIRGQVLGGRTARPTVGVAR